MNVLERSGTDKHWCTYVRQTLRFHSLGGIIAFSWMKWRHGLQFEIMTSNQKPDSGSRRVREEHSWKSQLDLIWKSGAKDFLKRSHNKKNKKKKNNNKLPRYCSDDRMMPLYISIRSSTTASRGFSATARLSCIVLHQRPFKFWNYSQYADFHGREVRHGDSRKSRHTTRPVKATWS